MIQEQQIPSDISPISLGMVGGGEGAFIGAVHRIAARLDGDFQLVAGALSSDPERALRSALQIGIAPDRSYASFDEMARREAERADGIEAVVVVTPNHLHFAPAKAFLEAGIHVICDKPLTSTLADAYALKEVVDRSGRLFVLTHNYTGYPMVRQARATVANGELGRIRLVQVEYAQGWLATKVEDTGSKQAEWRTDPARSGAGGAIGDIGTHAFNLASFVSGLELESVAADLTSFVEGRRLDDNVNIMLRFAGGARGHLWASQVAAGLENGLRLRIFGEKAGLDWCQEDPNYLWITTLGGDKRLITRGGPGAYPAANRVSRVPSGHPEGYLEGFATLYQEAARAIRAARTGMPVDDAVHFPDINDGVRGLEFIDAAVRSSAANGVWTRLRTA